MFRIFLIKAIISCCSYKSHSSYITPFFKTLTPNRCKNMSVSFFLSWLFNLSKEGVGWTSPLHHKTDRSHQRDWKKEKGLRQTVSLAEDFGPYVKSVNSVFEKPRCVSYITANLYCICVSACFMFGQYTKCQYVYQRSPIF